MSVVYEILRRLAPERHALETPSVQSHPQTTGRLYAEGVDALRRGDATTARRRFDEIVAGGGANKDVWFALAMAAHACGDFRGAIDALANILKPEPNNLQALLMTGDCYDAIGDDLAAGAYYATLISFASAPERLPPEIAAEIRRAEVALGKYRGKMLAHLQRELDAVGYDAARASRRINDSIDMLVGVKKRYVEEPTSYFLPDLPQRAFYEREEFSWIPELEAGVDDIAGELAAVIDDPASFEAYVKRDKDRPLVRQHPLLDDPKWGALFLWREGSIVRENAARFPKTLTLLDHAPLDTAPGRAPMALFSRLMPGTRLPPHTGMLNTRLICHLPIIVPGDCSIRVGNEIRSWKRGEMLILNDSIEHEAWNASSAQRVVLLFSVWRPELTQEERRIASAVISASVSFKDASE